MFLFSLVLLGFFLRISYLNKPEGLWNDEHVSWFIANTSFDNGFWQNLIKQCHMPLYYLYLKPFAHFSDNVLRMTSVIPGVLSIIVMYFVGKEFSKKIGYFSAGITSVLSFLIFYSQEVRFYSLLFLFTSLSLLFMIRLLKKSSRLDFLGFFISSFFIVITHILGIIYVFFCISYIVYKSKNKKLQLKYFLPVIIILACCTLIFLPRISMMTEYSQWWGLFTYTNILFLFSDFFSPVLTNHVNAPLKFFYNKDLAVFMVVPTIIACTGLFAGIKQKKGFAFITFFTIISMCIIAKFRLIIFITKYAIEVLPIFILLCASGFARLKKFGIVLFSLLIFFHLYAFFTPLYVTKISRPEGNKYVGEVINMRKPQVVILTYYDPDKFRRYTNFDGMRVYHISKAERQFYKQHPERIFDNVKQNERISVVFLDSVTFADKYFLQSHAELLKNKTLDIEKVPEMFLTFSYIRTCLTDILANEYKDFELDQQGSWTIITATKK